MRILLIGNFSPPYDEEGLHNLFLLNRLKEEGNDCCVINLSENSFKTKGFIGFTNWIYFIVRLLRNIWRKDALHYLTKGYTRPALMRLMSSVCVGWFFRVKPIVTLHSEMFSILGRTRSKLMGEPSLRVTFALAHKVICTDRETYEAASYFKSKNNLEVIPLFTHSHREIKRDEPAVPEKLKGKKKVIIFANVIYPSFVFEILNHLLTRYPPVPDTAIVVSVFEQPAAKLQHVIEEFGRNHADNLVFMESGDIRQLALACGMANYVIRPLSCDSEILFPGFIAAVKKPVRTKEYLHFSTSLFLVKGGDISDLCASIIGFLLREERGELPPPDADTDFYARLKKIYQGQ